MHDERKEFCAYQDRTLRRYLNLGMPLYHLSESHVFENKFEIYIEENGGAIPVESPGSQLPMLGLEPCIGLSNKTAGTLHKKAQTSCEHEHSKNTMNESFWDISNSCYCQAGDRIAIATQLGTVSAPLSSRKGYELKDV